MIAMERLVQKVIPGKWAALEEVDKKFNALESRFGFPAKKRYQCMTGGYDTNTLIIERQWESLAALEAAYEKITPTPEYQALVVEMSSIIENQHIELYMPLP